MQRNTDGLLQISGLWFHTFTDKGAVQYQGQVCSVSERHVLVQLYEWLMGAPSNKKVFPIDDVVNWQFYDCSEDMNAYYARSPKPSFEHLNTHDDTPF